MSESVEVPLTQEELVEQQEDAAEDKQVTDKLYDAIHDYTTYLVMFIVRNSEEEDEYTQESIDQSIADVANYYHKLITETVMPELDLRTTTDPAPQPRSHEDDDDLDL